ncbi:MAG: hypothetical protein AAF226_03340, partial [Verrucomicrobiota bacterium]
MYRLGRHEEAEAPLDWFIENYADDANIEMVKYHRCSNALVQGKMRDAADHLDDFVKEFPDSANFLDSALADLSIARYNLEDYPAAIAAADVLKEKRPDSKRLPQTLLIEGDAYLVSSNDFRSKEQAEIKAEYRSKGLTAYLDSSDKGKVVQSGDAENADQYNNMIGEGIWKACDIYLTDGDNEKALAKYDEFFPTYEGTYWEPQISVHSLEALEEAGRGEPGLVQVEKMVNFLGNQPPEKQDITLLRQAIGSWSDASRRIRGDDETVKLLDNFPNVDTSNQALATWLKIQKIIVLQDMRKGMGKDTPEYAALETQINEVFEELRLFEMRNLSEFALQQIGLHFANNTDNPFLAVPYFEELLTRDSDGADEFKGPAEFELGRIEMRSPEAAKRAAARERFRRVIDKYEADGTGVPKTYTPGAYLNIAKLHMQEGEWSDANDNLKIINEKKNYFKSDREKRAEATFLWGQALDKMGDKLGANRAYLSVWSTYNAFPDWATQAVEAYIPNSLDDIRNRPQGTEEEKLAKRKSELTLYNLLMKQVYVWQKIKPEETPSGALVRLRRRLPTLRSELNISTAEDEQVKFDLGLPEDWNPEA